MAWAGPQRQTPIRWSLMQLKLIKPKLRKVILRYKINPEAKVRPVEIIWISPVTRKAVRKKKTPQTLILQLMGTTKRETKSKP